jgi:hypothetical protein
VEVYGSGGGKDAREGEKEASLVVETWEVCRSKKSSCSHHVKVPGFC